MTGCPVLRELAVTEDYDPEHEQAPVLSGGSYDITAIRDCGENCRQGALAYQRGFQITALEAERDRLRMQVKAAEDVIGKAASVITADTDAGLDALCAIQSWQITPTEMYYRNEAEAESARKEAPNA